jgi:hypothetical protein
MIDGAGAQFAPQADFAGGDFILAVRVEASVAVPRR